jgi:hypothetical protein
VAFNALVLFASLNPSLREINLGAESVLVHEAGRAGIADSVRPAVALRALWLFDAIWITCFNVALLVRQRQSLRLLLIVAVTNAGALGVLGVLQKVALSRGPYFGATPAPQERFFSTFFHHDSWGAFAGLMMAACLALVWHYGRRREARDFFPTPPRAGIAVLLLLAATVPLSASRSSTVVAIVLLGAAVLHGTFRLVQRRQRFNESIAPPMLGGGIALVVAAAAIAFVVRGWSEGQSAQNRQDVASTPQSELAVDTGHTGDPWQRVRQKPWFGWGMASSATDFRTHQTRTSDDSGPVVRHDAPSDVWQTLSEHGVVGSALLALCAVVPLLRLRRRHFSNPMPAYLLGGCTLVGLCALVGTPFGNTAVVLSWWLCFFSAVHYARLHDREALATESGPRSPLARQSAAAA